MVGSVFLITSWETKIGVIEINEPRSGDLYTYLYNYDQILGDPNKDKWLDDIADSFDFVYLLVVWRNAHKTNDTLNMDYMYNITEIAKELSNRGCEIVIHTWISSYHPSWLVQYVPELSGTSVRWQGLPEDHPNYWTLTYTNLNYQRLVAEHFQSHNITVQGFCLDDETLSDNWGKHMRLARDLLHSINSSWYVTVMFSSDKQYHLARNLDFLSIDPYGVDEDVAHRIRYSRSLGFEKISVLLSGMGEENEFNGRKFRRHAWMAWFMGAYSIGWWCYNIYWHGTRAGEPNDWFFMPYSPNGPTPGPKGLSIREFRTDNNLLNQIEAKRLKALQDQDLAKAEHYRTMLDKAYKLALVDNFDDARGILKEVLANE
jgi:6-pyruvoyl-tetrahydropterin synthase